MDIQTKDGLQSYLSSRYDKRIQFGTENEMRFSFIQDIFDLNFGAALNGLKLIKKSYPADRKVYRRVRRDFDAVISQMCLETTPILEKITSIRDLVEAGHHLTKGECINLVTEYAERNHNRDLPITRQAMEEIYTIFQEWENETHVS
jgi:hypothetical protein